MPNFVAVACRDAGTGHQQIMWTEDDGATWTQATGIGTTGQINKIKHKHGIWMCGDNLGHIYTSLDGKAWTFQATLTHQVYDLDYGNGNWIAVGGGRASISADDGATWAVLSLGVSWTSNPMGVVFGAANWVIGGGTSNASQPTLLTSTDNGVTWTPTTLPNISGQPMDTCEALVYANGITVSWGSVDNSPYLGTVAYSLDDGVTWTRVVSNLDSTLSWRFLHLTANGSTLFAAGDPVSSGTHAADPQESSTDGFTWGTVSTPWTSEAWKDTTWDGARFFMAGFALNGATQIMLGSSPDLVTWTAWSTPPGAASGASAVGALAALGGWTVGYLPMS